MHLFPTQRLLLQCTCIESFTCSCTAKARYGSLRTVFYSQIFFVTSRFLKRRSCERVNKGRFSAKSSTSRMAWCHAAEEVGYEAERWHRDNHLKFGQLVSYLLHISQKIVRYIFDRNFRLCITPQEEVSFYFDVVDFHFHQTFVIYNQA